MTLELDNCSIEQCYGLLFAALNELRLAEDPSYREGDHTNKQQLAIHIDTLRAAIDGKMSEQALTLAKLSEVSL